MSTASRAMRLLLVSSLAIPWALAVSRAEERTPPPSGEKPPPRPQVNLSLPPGSFPPAPRPRFFAESAPSPVIYPDQKLRLRFSHAQHLAMKTECIFCHESAAKSTSARDNLLPREEVCESCHNIDHEEPFKKVKVAAACAACHPGFPAQRPAEGFPAPGPELEALVEKVILPEPNLKFNHQIHIEQKIACERCHGDLRKVEMATRDHLPRMPLCLSCHNDGVLSAARGEGGKRRPASPRCGTCHVLDRDGMVKVHYESGTLIPSGNWRGDTHGPEWKREHRAVARQDPGYCESCHQRIWCQSCHNGVVKPMDFHGNDYVSRHPIDARRDDPRCSGCHRRQTFCLGCHERLGVVDKFTLPGNPQPGAFSPAGPRRFHPDGWASPAAGPGHHAEEAQRNIRACVSCHREDTCLQCHSALPGSRFVPGVNPHPLDWAESQRCRSLSEKNGRMCLKCHRAESPQLTCSKF